MSEKIKGEAAIRAAIREQLPTKFETPENEEAIAVFIAETSWRHPEWSNVDELVDAWVWFRIGFNRAKLRFVGE